MRIRRAAVLILLGAGIIGLTANEATSKRGPGNRANASSADTTILYGPTRFYADIGGAEYEIEFTADTILGKRFLIELVNGSAPVSAFVAKVDSQQWIGSSEWGTSVATLTRIFEIGTTGSHTVDLLVNGSSTSKWATMRIVRVTEPTFLITGPQYFVKPSPAALQYGYFSKANAGETDYTLRAINGTPSGGNRMTSTTIKLNRTSVMSSSDFGTGIATITKNITVTPLDTIEVNNQGAAISRAKLYVRATDQTAPVVSVTQPPSADTVFTKNPGYRFTGSVTDETPGWLSIADTTWHVTRPLIATPGTFNDSMPTPQQGRHRIRLQVTNSAKLTTTLERCVFRDTVPPVFTVSSPPTATDSISVAISGSWSDSTFTTVTVDGDTVGTRWVGSFGMGYPLDLGPNRIIVRATDQLGNSSQVMRYVFRRTVGEPDVVDSTVVGSTMDLTGRTRFYDGIRFIFANATPLQFDVDTTRLIPDLVSVLRGKVDARDGSALPNVNVSVLNHLEYGYTLTREDGRFDLVVNGGFPLALRFLKAGYLEVQRAVEPHQGDYAFVDSVAMIGQTVKSALVDTAAAMVAVARFASDANGDRVLRMFFDQGATARVVGASGPIDTFATFRVRAKEFTVGGEGPESMPALLPPGSAYTYCVELSVDQADSLGVIAGAPVSAQFTKPVACYVKKFLNLPVGTHIPMGYYDRSQGMWKAGADGLVIKIKNIAGGAASVDATGDDVAESNSALDALGIDATERTQLAGQFAVDDTLWRASVDHFSPWDFNLNLVRVAAAMSPAGGNAGQPQAEVGCQETAPGSIVGCENRTLGERIPIVGTPYSLNYISSRAFGDKVQRTLRIPIGGLSVPSGIQRVIVNVDVAGQRLQQIVNHSPAADEYVTVPWNGLDAYGRRVVGSVSATVLVGYQFGLVYAAGTGGVSFGDQASNRGVLDVAVGDRGVGRMSWRRQTVGIGAPSMESAGLGGWTISPHHFYDGSGRGTIYYGDGTFDRGRADPLIWGIAVGGSSRLNPDVVKNFNFTPQDMTIGPDGSLYVSDGLGAIERIASDRDSIYLVAGKLSSGDYEGDGNALSTYLTAPRGIALGPDGAIYFVTEDADATHGHRVLRVSGGQIKTIANSSGLPAYPATGLGGPAVDAELAGLQAIAVGPDGSVFVSAGTGTGSSDAIHRIWPNGRITQYAGGGSTQGAPDSALSIKMLEIKDMAADRYGNLYVAEKSGLGTSGLIRKISPDGWSTILATDPFGQDNWNPYGIWVDDGGVVWFTTVGSGRAHIHRLDPDGTQSIVAGIGPAGVAELDGRPALAVSLASPNGVVTDGDGSILFAEPGGAVRRLGRTIPSTVPGEVIVPNSSGSEVYAFTPSGRHLRTRDALTGGVRCAFTYDSGNRLHAIYDANGDSTIITRSGGQPQAITAPYGQQTQLTLLDGYLRTVANPANETIMLTTDSDGLLNEFRDAKNNLYEFTYAGDGRLSLDEDPAGGSQELSEPVYNASGNSHTHHRETAEDRRTAYTITTLYEGTEQRMIGLVDGADTLRTYFSDSTDGRRHTHLPDGTLIVDSLVSDPRFGMLAPVIGSLNTRLPSGKARVVESTSTYTPSNFNPPFMPGQWAVDVKVNGRTPSRTEFNVSFNPDSFVLRTRSPVGRVTKAVLDSASRPLTLSVPGLADAAFSYYDTGLLHTVTQADRQWTYTYDDSGRVRTAVDALGHTMTYHHDAADRLRWQTMPDTQSVAFTYDANDNLATLTPPGRPAHTFASTPVDLMASYVPPVVVGADSVTYVYDRDRLLKQVHRPDGTDITIDLESNTGRTHSIATPHGSATFTYLDTGPIESITGPDSVTLSYTYDGSLPLSETSTDPYGSHHVDLTYDSDFRPMTQTVDGASSITLSYDLDELLTGAGAESLSYAASNGLLDHTTLNGFTATSVLSANPMGELSNLQYAWSGGGWGESIHRNAAGQVDSLTQYLAGDTTHVYRYVYTTAGRLKDVSRGSNLLRHYEYDANGNRRKYEGWTATGRETASADYDAQDRMTRYGNTAYVYTRSGELALKIAGGDTTKYTYDPLGNLVKVILASPHDTIQYVIDGRNRRVGRKVNREFVQGWVYQNELNVVAELNGSRQVTTRYVYGSRGHVPDYMVKNGATYRLITDHLGSVRFVVNASTGVVAERIDYDAFGDITRDDSPGTVSLGYVGGIWDAATGLVRFGARDYDGRVGRWTARDPLGFAAHSANLFEYAHSAPQNFVDVTGLGPDPPHLWRWFGGGWRNGEAGSEEDPCYPSLPSQRGFMRPLNRGDECAREHDVHLRACSAITDDYQRQICRRDADIDLAVCVNTGGAGGGPVPGLGPLMKSIFWSGFWPSPNDNPGEYRPPCPCPGR